MPSLGNLFVNITANLDGLRNAESASGRLFSNIQRAGRRSMLAIAGAATGAAVGVAALTQASLSNIDAMSKQSRMLNTSTSSMQVLARAADLAGLSMGQIESATRRFATSLGEAKEGTGPASDAMKRLRLEADALYALPIDERIALVNERIKEFIPEAEQAAVAADLFGRSGLAITLLDTSTLAQAASDVRDFGLAVSDVDAQQIEVTNDALSRMGLVATSIGNQIAVAVAPALQLMADRFAEATQKGTPMYEKLQMLIGSFQSLAETLSSQESIDAMLAGLGGLATLAEGAARGLIFLTENTEIAFGAISAIGLAMLGLAGPFGVIALGAGATVALYTAMKNAEKPTDDFKTAADEAKSAVELLNSSLNSFSTSASPTAQGAALGNAQAYKQQAMAALEAARAALIEKRSREDAANNLLDQNPLTAGGNSGYAEAIGRDVSAAEAEVLAIERSIEEASNRIKLLVTGITSSDVVVPSGPGPTPDANGDGTGDGEPTATGLGAPSAIEEEFQARLEALQTGLALESEVIAAAREQALVDLEEAKNRGLITEEEYRANVESLEAQHQAALADMRQKASKDELNMRRTTINGAIGLLQQFGSKNKAFAKAAVALNAAQRVSEIAANTAAASTRALAELGPIAGPPAAARIAAYGAVQKGIAIASAAMSMGGGGGSSGVSIGSSGESSGQSAAGASGSGGAEDAMKKVLTLVGDNFNAKQVQEAFEFGNRLSENGFVIGNT